MGPVTHKRNADTITVSQTPNNKNKLSKKQKTKPIDSALAIFQKMSVELSNPKPGKLNQPNSSPNVNSAPISQDNLVNQLQGLICQWQPSLIAKNTELSKNIINIVVGNWNFIKEKIHNLDPSLKEILNSCFADYNKRNQDANIKNFKDYIIDQKPLPEHPENIFPFYKMAYLSKGSSFKILPENYWPTTVKNILNFLQLISKCPVPMKNTVWKDLNQLASSPDLPLHKIAENIMALNPPPFILESLFKCILNNNATDILQNLLSNREYTRSFTPDHWKCLNVFFDQKGFHDVTLVLDGQSLKANQAILAASIDYFNPNLNPNIPKDREEINLNGSNFEINKALVQFCYGIDFQLPVNVGEIFNYLINLYAVADHLSITRLKQKILYLILERNWTNDFFKTANLLHYLPCLLEIAVQEKDRTLFDFSLRLAREHKIDWCRLPKCCAPIVKSLEIPEFHDVSILFMGSFFTGKQYADEVACKINQEILTSWRKPSISFSQDKSIHLGHIRDKNSILEFFSFLCGDSLPENREAHTYYGIALKLGISPLILPEFYSLKNPANLKWLFARTHLDRKDYANLAFEDELMDEMLNIDLGIADVLLSQILESKNVDWLKKFLKSSYFIKLISLQNIKDQLMQIEKDFDLHLLKRWDLSGSIQWNKIILQIRSPKLDFFLKQGNPSDTYSAEIIKTLITFSIGEFYFPMPVTENFLLDLFEASDYFEIPLKSKYLEYIQNQPKVFAADHETLAFLAKFPEATDAVRTYLSNSLSEAISVGNDDEANYKKELLQKI